MLTAVQIFNNPQIEFKAELFIVTSVVAWTYLFHAYYRKKGIEYRRFTQTGQRRKFLKTRWGAVWHWSLDECLESSDCPVEEIVKKNLRFLIGVRNEIEHQMTTRIDHQFSAKFQASAVNFNRYIKKLFGHKYSLDAEQADRALAHPFSPCWRFQTASCPPCDVPDLLEPKPKVGTGRSGVAPRGRVPSRSAQR